MSYNSFLDSYFSELWFFLGIPLILMVVYLIIRQTKLIKRAYTFGERLIVTGICFVLMMTGALINPMYWGYGNPRAIDDIRLLNGKLCVLDHINSLGGRYSAGDPYSRIHVVNPADGSKILRFPVGVSADLVGIHGDSICVSRYNDVAYYSQQNGKSLIVYSRETLPGIFPELSSGVNQIMWADGRNVMEITAQNATKWNLYTVSGKLVPAEKNGVIQYPDQNGNVWIHEREIRKTNEESTSTLIELKAAGASPELLSVYDGNDSLLSSQLTFLSGKPIAADLKNNCFFILHFESLKQEKCIISCVSIDGKKLIWELHQSQFNSEYNYPEVYKPQTCFDEARGVLYFSIANEIFAVDGKDGKLIWRTKL